MAVVTSVRTSGMGDTPIPGPDGALEPGRRLMNFVWYRNVASGAPLQQLMTDRHGQTRPVSLPPGAARAEVLQDLRADAARLLAPVIADVVTAVPEPFVQVVFDIEVPRMVHGRVCLIGDAAFAEPLFELSYRARTVQER